MEDKEEKDEEKMTDKEKIYQNLVDKFYTTSSAAQLNALIILSCNGNGPTPFSKATINYVQSNIHHNFAVWFDSGLFGIANAFLGNYTFVAKNIFGNMLKAVFSETEHLDCLLSVLHSQHNSEAKIRNTLAIHYFQPLVYGSSCFVDKGGSDICEYCKKKVQVDDTSLGNPKIWHGRTDIIINNSAVRVQCDSDELDKKMFSYAKEQALAEAIVNAFCEAKKNKSFSKKFIPSFLASEKEIRIILYNCDSDILLFSDPLPIWRPTCTDESILNVDTLMQVWLALNFDSFNMEVDGEVLKRTRCSNFKQAVGDNAYHLYLTQVSKPCKFKNENGKVESQVEERNDTIFVVSEIQKQQYFRIKNLRSELCQ